jgi:hypothetical protein
VQYLNWSVIDRISTHVFQKKMPYPWGDIHGTLTEEGFARLRETLPDVSHFERKVGVKRAYGQAPHDRAILHYRPGLELSLPWKEFVAQLQGEAYQSFLRRMLDLLPHKRIILTMEWYYAWAGCSVSPHWDAWRKLATHIFYFNTEADWNAHWGGQIRGQGSRRFSCRLRQLILMTNLPFMPRRKRRRFLSEPRFRRICSNLDVRTPDGPQNR